MFDDAFKMKSFSKLQTLNVAWPGLYGLVVARNVHFMLGVGFRLLSHTNWDRAVLLRLYSVRKLCVCPL